jgi:D-glycero-alpha-D-manno-heptose 1-phosphate guanylyltransferase
MDVRYAVETAPLGTGGAIRNALASLGPGPALVLNGDTWLELDYAAMMAAHVAAGASVSIAVVRVDDTARFGAVQVDRAGRVTGFTEKGRTGEGLINGGAYVVQSDVFDAFVLPDAFSFETDFLRTHLERLRPLAFETRGAFIDIGVPESWQEAQSLLGPR